jgi:hypothetical protein
VRKAYGGDAESKYEMAVTKMGQCEGHNRDDRDDGVVQSLKE